MRFGKRKHLDAFVLGLIPIGDGHSHGSKPFLKLAEDSRLQNGNLGGILERYLSLSLHLWEAKFAGGLIAFAPITRLTCKRQIRCTIRAASAPRSQVLDLE